MSSPHLEELGILCSSHASTNEGDLEFWDSVYQLEFEFEELRTVKVSEISGAPHELQFVKLLLKHAPALETMRITRSTDCSLNMLTELLMFRRASAKAEIAYINGIRRHEFIVQLSGRHVPELFLPKSFA